MNDEPLAPLDEETGKATGRMVEFSERPTILASKQIRKSISHDITTGKEGVEKNAFVAEVRIADRIRSSPLVSHLTCVSLVASIQIRKSADCVPRRRRTLHMDQMIAAAKDVRNKLKHSKSDLSDDEGLRVSMHGRLMVQKSTVFDRSDNEDAKNGKDKGVQYCLSVPEVCHFVVRSRQGCRDCISLTAVASLL